ncbi:cellulose binding domain-containing protein [Micromonospora sp. C28SCA-DRY-2]|uniref:cellulose binding domain-containing protein n=1 Tax=Micromonospora sp. C28SCA-DRY-2 TaxID=3059522 RepID=UPI0026770860|nr:cellulose binding domain-containing protein [Micromonospora sp. C28SCA-DRY-2]MDO3703444.1 cellulose binding domain-containing protein [Micromonospora sp. C28SCA-DRY-2]
MSVRPVGDPERHAAPRVLASVPWVIVLLGVALLAAMLVVALVAFRAPERRPAAAPPPVQPLALPSLPVLPGLSASPLSAAPTPTPVTPSAGVTSRPPVPASDRSPRTADRADGAVTASYRVTESGRDSFTARLVVGNGTGDAREWRVELVFGGNVKSIEVSSGGAGVAVSARDGGRFVVRGTGALGAGQSRTIGLRFTRHGTGDRPGSCTVNGAACVIG